MASKDQYGLITETGEFIDIEQAKNTTSQIPSERTGVIGLEQEEPGPVIVQGNIKTIGDTAGTSGFVDIKVTASGKSLYSGEDLPADKISWTLTGGGVTKTGTGFESIESMPKGTSSLTVTGGLDVILQETTGLVSSGGKITYTAEKKSISTISEFLELRDGISIIDPDTGLPFANTGLDLLFTLAEENEVDLLAGNDYTKPHAISEFIGASFENAPDLTVNILSNPAEMRVKYGTTWGSHGHDDGILVEVGTDGYPFDHFDFTLKDVDSGVEIATNRPGVRFAPVYENTIEVGGKSYKVYYIVWGYSSLLQSTEESGSWWRSTVTKSGKTLYHVYELTPDPNSPGDFLPDGGDMSAAVVNNSIKDGGGTNGDTIWDTVKRIYQSSSSYTAETGAPSIGSRIPSTYNILTINKYFFSNPSLLGSSNSSGTWSNNPLSFFGEGGTQFGVFRSPNRTTSTVSGGTWSYTVPAGVTKVRVSAVGGGGGSYAAHDGGYGQFVYPGGVGSGFVADVNVVPGDILSGKIGDAGGAGYYNGGTGGVGGPTTLKKGNTLIATAVNGSRGLYNARGTHGTATRAAGWESHADSITLHKGTFKGPGALTGGDSSCPACGYDAWGYPDSVSYSRDDIGIAPLQPSYPTRNFKLIVSAITGGDRSVTGYDNKAKIRSTEEIDITITPDASTGSSVGGLGQCFGWVIVDNITV